MSTVNATKDEAAHLIAAHQLAGIAWNGWSRSKIEPLVACTAITFLVEEALDKFPELREAMRVGLQAAIDQERAP